MIWRYIINKPKVARGKLGEAKFRWEEFAEARPDIASAFKFSPTITSEIACGTLGVPPETAPDERKATSSHECFKKAFQAGEPRTRPATRSSSTVRIGPRSVRFKVEDLAAHEASLGSDTIVIKAPEVSP